MTEKELTELEYFKEVRVNSTFVPSCMGKPKGHNIELFVTRTPGALLYRRHELGKNQTWVVS